MKVGHPYNGAVFLSLFFSDPARATVYDVPDRFVHITRIVKLRAAAPDRGAEGG